MRKSRLYLSLSIISMIAAVGVGIAQGQCERYCPVTTCSIIYDHEHQAISAFEARDFDAMNRHANALISDGDTLNGRRWNAYSLRGQGRLDEAISAYHESMHRESGHAVPLPVLIDSYVGLADCFARQGLRERARDWIDRAQEDAVSLLREHQDQDTHYQLACVLAVRSSIEEGPAAEVIRSLALEQLRLAIRHGFDNWDHLRADIDVDALRSDPRFQTLFPN